MRLELRSPAFDYGQPIPREYTGEGVDVSPPLEWSNVPEGTREFVLICEDPDAPGGPEDPFVHWVAYGIPPTVTALPRGIPAGGLQLQVPVEVDQGENSFGEIGYHGPMPPRSSGPHRYIFRLYALAASSGLGPGLPKPDVLKAIDPLVLSTTETLGRYERARNKPLKGQAA